MHVNQDVGRNPFTAVNYSSGSLAWHYAYIFLLAILMAPSIYPANSSEKSLPKIIMFS